jgi:hypothetical protein
MPNLPWPRKTICQLSIIGTAHSVQVVNVFHFEAAQTLEATLTSDQVAQVAAGDLADAWLTNLKTPWLACHTNSYNLQMVRAQVLERPGTFRHRLTPVERPTSGAGTITSGTPSAEAVVSAVIRWRTPIAGKSYRGRSYVGPVPTAWIAGGLLAAAGVTAYTGYITPYMAEYGAAGVAPEPWAGTIYSRPYNLGEYQYTSRQSGTLQIITPPDYAGNSTNVTQASVDPVLRTQRRRQYGVGA